MLKRKNLSWILVGLLCLVEFAVTHLVVLGKNIIATLKPEFFLYLCMALIVALPIFMLFFWLFDGLGLELLRDRMFAFTVIDIMFFILALIVGRILC